jgi:hypothetical protein
VAITRSPSVGVYYSSISQDLHERKKILTRPALYSTQTAFFFWSVQRSPATVGTIMFGGMCLSPGPSFKGNFGCEGKDEGSRRSPGRTKIDVAIVVLRKRSC